MRYWLIALLLPLSVTAQVRPNTNPPKAPATTSKKPAPKPGSSRPGSAAPRPTPATTAVSPVSLGNLRSARAGAVPDYIYVTDPGKEGLFRLDASDTRSADNTGTVIVTAGGQRYKRVLEQKILYVDQFGAIPNDGQDDVAAIQAAIDAARPLRTEVAFRGGSYDIIGNSVTVRSGVVLRGKIQLPFKAGFNVDDVVLHVRVGENNPNKPAFIVEPGSGMQGFTFFWPKQSKTAERPIPYGWAITTRASASSADNVTLRDIMLTNCYQGINMDFGGQFLLSNIAGQTFHTGIRLDRIYDVARVENIHFWDYWAGGADPAKRYVQRNGQAVVVGKVDNVMCTNVFAWGHKHTVRFADFGHGGAWVQMQNVASDNCYVPVLIERANIIQINGLVTVTDDKASGRAGIETGPSVGGSVQINNWLAYKSQTGANIESANGTFRFTNAAVRRQGDNADVWQYKIINQRTASVFVDQADFNDVAGAVNVGPVVRFAPGPDVTPAGFDKPHTWQAFAGCTAIPNGSRFNLRTGVNGEVRRPLPLEPGVYLIDLDVQTTRQGGLGPAQFYLRLDDDMLLPGHHAEPHFTEKTHLRVPFLVRRSGQQLQFVFGGSTAASAHVDITNLKITRVSGLTQTALDWLQQSMPNARKAPAPALNVVKK